MVIKISYFIIVKIINFLSILKFSIPKMWYVAGKPYRRISVFWTDSERAFKIHKECTDVINKKLKEMTNET